MRPSPSFPFPNTTLCTRLTVSKRHLHPAIHRTQPHQPRPSSTLAPTLLSTTNIPAPHCGHIRILCLNNPRSKNAISRQLLSELREEVELIRGQGRDEEEGRREEGGGGVGQGARVLILASELDDVFCAGADLKERRGMSGDETKEFLNSLRSTFSALSALPIPTISAVSSLALGGGLELALSTDMRIFTNTATVGLPETRLAIIPGAGGTYRLQRLVGKSKAVEMILTGQRYDGTKAREMGMCERLVTVQDGESRAIARKTVLGAAITMAKQICGGGPVAIGAALKAVRGGTEQAENEEYETVLKTEDRVEALRAFAEKRDASFTGR